MPACRPKRARKLSDGPQEVEHLSLCGARGERGKRGMVVLERYYGTLKYLYECSAVATPREAGRARSVPVRVLFCGGQGGRCGVGKNVNLIKPPCRSFRYR